MPNSIRLMLSAVIFVTVMIVHFLLGGPGHGLIHWLVLVAGGVIIVVLWMFPQAGEPRRQQDDTDTRGA